MPWSCGASAPQRPSSQTSPGARWRSQGRSTDWRAPASRSTRIKRVAPAAARWRATARPMPDAAPVMSARRLLRAEDMPLLSLWISAIAPGPATNGGSSSMPSLLDDHDYAGEVLEAVLGSRVVGIVVHPHRGEVRAGRRVCEGRGRLDLGGCGEPRRAGG